jgi:hypothetical protein
MGEMNSLKTLTRRGEIDTRVLRSGIEYASEYYKHFLKETVVSLQSQITLDSGFVHFKQDPETPMGGIPKWFEVSAAVVKKYQGEEYDLVKSLYEEIAELKRRLEMAKKVFQSMAVDI